MSATMPVLPPHPARNTDSANFVVEADAFVAALPGWGTAANVLAAEVETNAANAETSAQDAASSANAAGISEANAAASAASALAAANTSGTSATSLAIGTGSKSLTTQTGKSFAAGQSVVLVSSSTPNSYMLGTVTSYTTGTGALVVNVTNTGGSGTLADWIVAFSGSLPNGRIYGMELVTDGIYQSWGVSAGSAAGIMAFLNM